MTVSFGSFRKLALIAIFSMASAISNVRLNSADPIPLEPVPAALKTVPQNLLKLIHAPEVQKELELEGEALDSFLIELAKIDGPWWRVRIRPLDEQRKVIAKQEQALIDLLNDHISPKKMERLKQIELQSQGTRIFARPDVIKTLNLTKSQSAKVDELYAATDNAAKKLQGAKAQDKKLIADLKTATEAEAKGIAELLTGPQKNAFGKMMGATFDTMKLNRIYPLAPELVDSGYWYGPATKLADQRGKVVLVHFYAFQCHNCVANFKHYNRWHEQLAKRGVSVIGIQTPETPAERDVGQVLRAAKEKGFGFPVLVDVKNSNWDTWSNTMWPTVYVIDKNGYIRFWYQGELNWEGATVDKTIEKLVSELLEE
jgi:peroxiredoxin